jgi:hypothetical protein
VVLSAKSRWIRSMDSWCGERAPVAATTKPPGSRRRPGEPQHAGGGRRQDVAQDGRRVATGTSDGQSCACAATINLKSAARQRPRVCASSRDQGQRALQCSRQGAVRTISFRPDGARLAVGAEDQPARPSDNARRALTRAKLATADHVQAALPEVA